MADGGRRTPERRGVRARPPWLALGLAAAALAVVGTRIVVALWPPGAEAPRLPGRGSSPPPAEPGVRTEGLHLIGRREGVRQWEADARRIVQPLSGKTIQFQQVENGVLYRDGEIFLRFEGDGGIYEEATGQLRLEGAFRLEHAASHRLTARNLVWDAARQELVTREPVYAQGQKLTVEARAMALDVKAGVAHLTGGVVVYQEDGTRLEAAAADWHLDSGEIVLYGPSAVERELSGGSSHREPLARTARPADGYGPWPR